MEHYRFGGRKRQNYFLPVFISVFVVAIAFGITLFYVRKQGEIIPGKFVAQSGYPLYAPTPLPQGYAVDKKTLKYENGITFYNITDGQKQLVVTEQAVPQHPPDLNSFPGFKKFSTLAGDAIIGSNMGHPTVILMTNTTLVSITGSKETPKDVVIKAAQGMSSLHN
jgi:hypothetical protein